VVPVSVRTEAGLDDLRAALELTAGSVRSRADGEGSTRLHIDRVFTIRGAGTVVTGTLWSGSIAAGEQLTVLPAGTRVRVRAVQVHDHPVDRAPAGQRVAVNLTGTGRDELARGDVLCTGDLEPTYLIDAELDIDAEHSARVQVHHGTRETAARVAWLGGRFWQLRLEQPLIPAARDRLVIRQIAPPDTLGGGVVLDPHPRKHGPGRELTARLERLSRGEPDPQPETPAAHRAAEPEPPALGPTALALEERLRQAGFQPPLDAELEADDLAALRAAKRAIRVSKSLHYHPDTLATVRDRVIELAERNGGAFTLAELRDELDTSRKFAQALLDHLDSERFTIRRGDVHQLRRGSR
jgi:selenocysteine-specific elongation factor